MMNFCCFEKDDQSCTDHVNKSCPNHVCMLSTLPCVSLGGLPEISRRASWVVPETNVGSTKQMCSYLVWAPNTNFSQIWKSLPIPHDKVHLCGFAALFLFPQMKSVFLGRAFFALVLKRTGNTQTYTHNTNT